MHTRNLFVLRTLTHTNLQPTPPPYLTYLVTDLPGNRPLRPLPTCHPTLHYLTYLGTLLSYVISLPLPFFPSALSNPKTIPNANPHPRSFIRPI